MLFGEIIVAGAQEDIVREKRNYTGVFLKPVLAWSNPVRMAAE
jgi:hypothetical protein